MIPLFSLAVDFLFMLLFNFKKKKKKHIAKDKDFTRGKKKEKPIMFIFSLYIFCMHCNIESKDFTTCMQDRDGQAIIIALRSISKGEEVCLCLYLIALFFLN